MTAGPTLEAAGWEVQFDEFAIIALGVADSLGSLTGLAKPFSI